VAYTQTSFGALQAACSGRLNDPLQRFWTQAEVILYLQDALRLWQALTADAKVWWVVPAQTSGAWCDLLSMTGSPRPSTFQDIDIYQRMIYMMLENGISSASNSPLVLSTSQFTAADLVGSVQRARDEFLMRAACVLTVESIVVTPNVATISVPEHVIMAIAGYWIPTASPSLPVPLYRSDVEVTNLYVDDSLTPGIPNTFSLGVEPELTLTLSPPPDQPGKVELLCVESQSTLNAVTPTALYLPSDISPAIAWGALADLLNSSAEKQDALRAAYARTRFEQYIELAATLPTIFAAKSLANPVPVDSAAGLDSYDPQWRGTGGQSSMLALAGGNLFNIPTALTQPVSVLVATNAPLPVLTTDIVQLNSSVVDIILGYAVHIAKFKCGNAELEATSSALKNLVSLAATRNSQVRALATMRDVLYGKVERDIDMDPVVKEAHDGE
jgi:hypothetical protein